MRGRAGSGAEGTAAGNISVPKEAQWDESEFIEAVLDTTASLVVVLDREGCVVRFNKACEAASGYAACEMVGQHYEKLLPADELASVRDHFGQLVHGGSPGSHENYWQAKDGSLRFFAWSNTVIPDESGNVLFVVATGIDITDRRRAEGALRASEEKFRTVFEQAAVGIGRVRFSDARWIDVNDALCRMVGYSREELLAIPWPQLTHADDLDLSGFRRMAAGEIDSHRSEKRFLHAQGRHVWVRVTVSLVRDARGRPDFAVTIIEDITDRKLAERRLEQSRAELDAALRSMSDGVFIADAEGALVEMNDAYVRINKFRSREECPREPCEYARFIDIQHIDGTPMPMEQWAVPRALRGETVTSTEHRLVRKDTGESWYGSFSFGPIRDEQGAIIGAVVVGRDITAMKHAERALRDSEERFRAVVDEAADAFFQHDLEGQFLDVNRQACEGLGYTREELLQMNVLDVVPGIDLPTAKGLWAQIRPGEPFALRGHHRRKDGSVFPVEVHFSVVDVHGERLIVGLGRNMTERERAEAEIREANEKLREEARRKNEFLAVLSHELRNPLAPIRSSLYVLRNAPPGGDSAGRAAEIIERQVQHMTRLIDDLLDVTRISRGKVTLQRERVELNSLTLRTAEDHRELFRRNGVDLEVRPAGQPLWVDGDPTRLTQVVGNLLHNAAKFTLRGGRAVATLEANAQRQAVLRVRDEGVGIAPETLGRLFEPFVQGPQTIERNRGGLGLGLALVKALVEMHGGEVVAHSAGEGEGSEFTLTLPLQAPAGAVRPTASRAPGSSSQGRRVLLVEDNEDIAESLRRALQIGRHEVVVAHTGPEGVEQARAHRPDVVLCDIGLPGLDGYGVARALRADSDSKVRSTYLVALSGYALQEDVEKSKQAGFDCHVAKPPDIERLLRLVAEAPALEASS